MHGVDHVHDLAGGAVELGLADDHFAPGSRFLREPPHERAAVLLDAGGLLPEHALDLAQQVDEGGLAVTRGVREIRAAPERLTLGRQEHGQRPAAVLAQVMQRRHVDLVDVGALLAVDFDVDEELVHHLRGGRVLEALVRHHVAPMAGGVADRQQDRLVTALGLRQRLGSPRPPVHRVVLVLQEIRARLASEAVLVGTDGGRRHAQILVSPLRMVPCLER